MHVPYALMLIPMTLGCMQGHGGSGEENIQRWIILTSKQAVSIKLYATVGHLFTWPWPWLCKRLYGLISLLFDLKHKHPPLLPTRSKQANKNKQTNKPKQTNKLNKQTNKQTTRRSINSQHFTYYVYIWFKANNFICHFLQEWYRRD